MHNLLITIATFIIVFGILVIVHEFGHFYFAKKSGILVREFSIGMGPKILAFRKNNTSYTLRLLPVGGYVRMAGAQEDVDDLQPGKMVSLQLNDDSQVVRINASDKQMLFQGIPVQVSKFDLVDELWIEGYENADENQFKRFYVNHDATIIEQDGIEVQIAPRDVHFESAKLWQRALVSFAGPLNNFILAVVVFALVGLLQGGVPAQNNKLGVVSDNSVAQKAGLKAGDQILALDHKKVTDWTSMATKIQSSAGQKVAVTYKRGASVKTITVVPKKVTVSGQTIGLIGVSYQIKYDLASRIMYGFTGTWAMIERIWHALANLFTGGFTLNKLGGPVAIFANTEQAAQNGVVSVLTFMAFLSVNLGIVNLLPIPALDGGKLLLNLVEAVRRKKLSEKSENAVQIAGFVFLMLLMLAVTFNDIYRYFIK
ncbi:regulator of sigma E protease [Weissella beninensis]|nr:regulator of sigma E protease [Periweissella beninensis]